MAGCTAYGKKVTVLLGGSDNRSNEEILKTNEIKLMVLLLKCRPTISNMFFRITEFQHSLSHWLKCKLEDNIFVGSIAASFQPTSVCYIINYSEIKLDIVS